ncbi:hypothetical protein ACLOJK_009515 [Asimina triloba]
MACEAIRTWSFSTLVGAFLDLAIAYLLLCCSALAFLAAKFLAFFRLTLPCPCNGLFGDPYAHHPCLQQLLVDAPVRRIAGVHASVRSRFPFDSIWDDNDAAGARPPLNAVKFALEEGRRGLLELRGGEESCSSLSEARDSRSSTSTLSRVEGDANSCVGRRGRGKAALHAKPPLGLRRRRRAVAADHGKNSAVSSSSDAAPIRPYVARDGGGEKGHMNSGGDGLQDYAQDVSTGISLSEGVGPGVESNPLLSESNLTDKESSFVQELVRSARGGDPELVGYEANTLRILEQALEEEHAARTALYLELEKERSAAASAADEAMAMILRLQEEKALIEMEARQYQRMIEEKYAYDEEEMNILKEILVRREREKHFLEKEVEFYRNVMLSGDRIQLSEDDLPNTVDLSGQRPSSSFDSAEDPMTLMLQQLSESIKKKEIGEDARRSPGKEPCTENQNTSFVIGNESTNSNGAEDDDFIKRGDLQRAGHNRRHYPHVQECTNEGNQEFQEKGMVHADDGPLARRDDHLKLEDDSFCVKSVDQTREAGFQENSSIRPDERQTPGEESGTPGLPQGAALYTDDHPFRGVDFKNSQPEMEVRIHDVHVVDVEKNICKDDNGKESELLLVGSASGSSKNGDIPIESSGVSNVGAFDVHPSSSRVEAEEQINRSISDIGAGFITPDGSGKVSFADARRASLSEVDLERLKLEREVARLTERLKIVQQGREKLSFSVEHREREKFQLQLLEEIASQLQEIRSLTQPGKAARQGSLPPTSSKAELGRRKTWVGWGLQGISSNPDFTSHNGTDVQLSSHP